VRVLGGEKKKKKKREEKKKGKTQQKMSVEKEYPGDKYISCTAREGGGTVRYTEPKREKREKDVNAEQTEPLA